jgi:pimeloyl-ACP methyl ester carboxylesterase
VWIGHSLGGVVALRAAVLRPDAVRGLVLAAAAGIGSATRAAQVTLAVLGAARPGRLIAPHRHAWARSRLGRRAAFGWWGVADPDALEPEVAEAFLVGPANHTDTRQAGRALLASDPRTELGRVTCPCLCLWGASDNWVRLDDGMEYARRLRAPLRAIAGCGHLLIGERADACLAAIGDFVDSLG